MLRYFTASTCVKVGACFPFLVCLAAFIALLPAAKTVYAQAPPDTTLQTSGSGAGLEILLTNSGFGLGGFYRYDLSDATAFLLEMSIGAGKDEREVKFFSYFGQSYIPNKANYLLMIPVNLGIQRRLFRNTIEDNFRPYVQVSGGPTIGWEYPYFRDCDGDGKFNANVECETGGKERTYDSITSFPRGQLRFGFGGILAVGANFGKSRKVMQGVRIGYAFSYFVREIELLEPDVPDGTQHFFGSPTISLTFGKLF